jgi:hypothetical protein
MRPLYERLVRRTFTLFAIVTMVACTIGGVIAVSATSITASPVAAATSSPPKSPPPTTPGTAPASLKPSQPSPQISSPTSLSPLTTVTGQVSLSSDGYGSNNPAGGPILVQKPAGATVLAAYLFAATTGETGYVPQDGDVTLDGTPITWNPSETIANNISSYNAEANVTSIVAPIVDAAPTGKVSFTVAEGNETYNYDGEALDVIFNDPTAPADNTVSILYGAQYTAGDSFNINLGTPIDTSTPGLVLSLGLGDSYGYQPTGQYSIIHVDGNLLTSSAGGQDDCAAKNDSPQDFENCGNGELITVGGIGDSTANPPVPSATDLTCGPPAAPRCDDELYNLLPFVSNGSTSIKVTTQNPSDDDNIFLANLDLTETTAVLGEGITLSPPSASKTVGGSDTETAKVVDNDGNPLSGQVVNFKVVSGPDAGKTGSGTSGPSGTAAFTFANTGGAGVDDVQASFTNSASKTFSSNTAKVTWSSTTKNTATVTLNFGSAPTYAPQSPVAPGTGIALEANVNPNGVTDPGPSTVAPTGTLTFFDGSTPISTVSLGGYVGSGFAAALTSKLSVGSHEITAFYSGDGTYPSATSNQVQITVATGAKSPATATPTEVELNFGSAPTYSEQSPVPPGNKESFTATITAKGIIDPGPTVKAPTGTVSFYDGTTLIGHVTVSSYEGTSFASLLTSALPSGSQEITALYNGDSTHPASTSNQVQVTVS